MTNEGVFDSFKSLLLLVIRLFFFFTLNFQFTYELDICVIVTCSVLSRRIVEYNYHFSQINQ